MPEPGMFLCQSSNPDSVNFEKRDIILVAGLLLVVVGLMPFMAPAYAILTAAATFFAIKFYMGRRQQAVRRDIGEGVCAHCGSRIYKQKCPECDKDA